MQWYREVSLSLVGTCPFEFQSGREIILRSQGFSFSLRKYQDSTFKIKSYPLPSRSFSFSIHYYVIILRHIIGIATGYGLDDQGVGVRVPVGSRIFSSPRRPDWLWGSPNLLSNGYPGVKRQGRVAAHSPPASAEVKKMWIYTSTPPYAFMAVLN
jgi:hypothetical protein